MKIAVAIHSADAIRAGSSVVMEVKGGKQVTLTPGQTFYEGAEPAPPQFLIGLFGMPGVAGAATLEHTARYGG